MQELLTSEASRFLVADHPVRTFHHEVEQFVNVAHNAWAEAREFVESLVFQSEAPYHPRPFALVARDLDNLEQYGSAVEAAAAEEYDWYHWLRAWRKAGRP